MPKPTKRVRETPKNDPYHVPKGTMEPQESNNSNLPCIIAIPGAMGSLSKATREWLDSEMISSKFRIITANVKWNTSNPGSKRNFEIINELIDQSKGPFTVLGNSFGNRVILRMLKENAFCTKPSSFVICGYPLYGPKENQDRVEALSALKDLRVAFISGTNDEFLNRSFMKVKGIPALEEILNEQAIEYKLFSIEGGKHSCPDCKGTLEFKTNIKTKVSNFLIDFLTSLK